MRFFKRQELEDFTDNSVYAIAFRDKQIRDFYCCVCKQNVLHNVSAVYRDEFIIVNDTCYFVCIPDNCFDLFWLTPWLYTDES